MKFLVLLLFSFALHESASCIEILKKIVELKLNEEQINDYLLSLESDYRAPFKFVANAIKDRYMIGLKKGTAIQNIMKEFKLAVSPFDRLFKIYHEFNELDIVSASMSKTSLNILRRLKQVDYVENDGEVRIFGNPSSMNVFAKKCITETNGEWCVSRISNSSVLNMDNYVHLSNAGKGVVVYIVDTGVRLDHTEFEGRATFGVNFVENEVDDDLHGHGTACASLACGKIAGSAKKCNIVAVKVLNSAGGGSNSDVIAGLLWTANKTKGIVSASLGGSKSDAVNSAVEFLVKRGQFVVVAAGNEASDACNTSPASAPCAFTIAASGLTNELAWFSNFGNCVDMIAPGVECLLADVHGIDAFTHFSGTSMATPLVAGVAAIWKAKYPFLSPSKIRDLLIKESEKNVITGDLKGTVNRFIHSNCRSSHEVK